MSLRQTRVRNFSHNLVHRTTSALGAATLLLLQFPCQAGEYQALCEGIKCTIVITPDLIKSPSAEISTSRVSFWGRTGQSKSSIGTGVATTVLFGGIGLLGFLAKDHHYDFTINGFDTSGQKASIHFEFRNDKPVKQLSSELESLTGLAMGQTRTIQEILAKEQGQEQSLPSLVKKDSLPVHGKVQQQTASTSQPSKNCWSTYLTTHPAMQVWAEANPTQAIQNKKKFDDC